MALLDTLPAAQRARIQAIAAASREQGVPAYLVGGFVRDLLLGRENRDLDVVVEGDGIELRRAPRRGPRRPGARPPAFLTAVMVDPRGRSTSTWRPPAASVYRAPAALPEVRASALRGGPLPARLHGQYLAIRLGPEPGAELIDLFDGAPRPRSERSLHVLHGRSFIDDPTRILRAVRLEQRLGFRISPETLGLIEEALAEGAFDRLSGSRLRAELILLLDDPAWLSRGIERLAELGVLRAIDPRLELDEATRERLREALAALDGYRREGLADPPVAAWRLFLLALAPAWRRRTSRASPDRLLLGGRGPPPADRRRRRAGGGAARRRAPDDPAPHQVAEALEPLAGEELLLLMAEGDEAVRAWVRRYLTELRPADALAVRGADLRRRRRPARAADRRGSARHPAGSPRRPRSPRRGELRLRSGVPAGGEPMTRSGSCCSRSSCRSAAPAATDDRSTEVLRFDCGTDLARREVTLFANGTIRLRDGAARQRGDGARSSWGRTSCRGSSTVSPAEDLEDVTEPRPGARGDLGRALRAAARSSPGRSPRPTASATTIPSPLNLSQVVHIADELAEKVEMVKERDEIPVDYEPGAGGRAEAGRATAPASASCAFTARQEGDRAARGSTQPLEIYVPRDQVRKKFTALVSRESSASGEAGGADHRRRVPRPRARRAARRAAHRGTGARGAVLDLGRPARRRARPRPLRGQRRRGPRGAGARRALRPRRRPDLRRRARPWRRTPASSGERLLEIRRLILPAGLARLAGRRLRPRLRRSPLQLRPLYAELLEGIAPLLADRRRDRRRAHLPPRAADRGRAADTGGRAEAMARARSASTGGDQGSGLTALKGRTLSSLGF